MARFLVFLSLISCFGRVGGAEPSGAADESAHLRQLGKRPYRLHDPSTIVRDGAEYWVFATGRGIISYRSKDLLTWTNAPRVFGNSPGWVTEAVPENRGGLDFWAPDVIKSGSKFFLYYSVSRFGRNTSAIALAQNRTLDPAAAEYHWRDEGMVVRSGAGTNFNAIDPAVTFDQQGRLWLAFGSFWDGIKLIELNPETGKRLREDPPMFSLARHESIEAPCIYFHGGAYYLFVNWGRCCRGAESTYEIRVGRSSVITGPYLDKEQKELAKGGGSLLLGTEGAFVGPGHAGILKRGETEWMSMHFYDATERGMSMLAIRQLTWDKEGWPRVEQEK